MSLASNKHRWKKACARDRVQQKLVLAPKKLECEEHGLFDEAEATPGDGCPICGHLMREVRE